jgi:hypothetical protein
MCGNIACIAAVLLGIDVGWQPLPEGGVEYIIQIEPQLLEALKSGERIQSDVPSYVKDVRAYRIVVGTAGLPRELPPKQVESPGSATATAKEPPTDPFLSPPAGPPKRSYLSGTLPSLWQPEAQSPDAPNLLQPIPDSKPIDAQPAGYLQRPSAAPQPESKSPSEREPGHDQSPEEAPAKPWTLLIVAVCTLFGSLGANCYLGWITWTTRSRYRSLVEGRRQAELA